MFEKFKEKAARRKNRIVLSLAGVSAAIATSPVACYAAHTKPGGALHNVGNDLMKAVKYLVIIAVIGIAGMCVIKKETSKLIATLIIGALVIALVFGITSVKNGGVMQDIGTWFTNMFLNGKD